MKNLFILSLLILSLSQYHSQQCQQTATLPNLLQTQQGQSLISLNNYFQGTNLNFSITGITTNGNNQNVSQYQNSQFQISQLYDYSANFVDDSNLALLNGKFISFDVLRGQVLNSNLYADAFNYTEFQLELGEEAVFLSQDSNNPKVYYVSQIYKSFEGMVVNSNGTLNFSNQQSAQCFNVQYIWNSSDVAVVVDCYYTDSNNAQWSTLYSVYWANKTAIAQTMQFAAQPLIATVSPSGKTLDFFQATNGQSFVLQKVQGSNNNLTYIQPFFVNPMNLTQGLALDPLDVSSLGLTGTGLQIGNFSSAGGSIFIYDNLNNQLVQLNTNFTEVSFVKQITLVNFSQYSGCNYLRARYDGYNLQVAIANYNVTNQTFITLIDFTNTNPMVLESFVVQDSFFKSATNVYFSDLDFNERVFIFMIQSQTSPQFLLNAVQRQTNNILLQQFYSTQNMLKVCVYCQAAYILNYTYSSTFGITNLTSLFNPIQAPFINFNLTGGNSSAQQLSFNFSMTCQSVGSTNIETINKDDKYLNILSKYTNEELAGNTVQTSVGLQWFYQIQIVPTTSSSASMPLQQLYISYPEQAYLNLNQLTLGGPDLLYNFTIPTYSMNVTNQTSNKNMTVQVPYYNLSYSLQNVQLNYVEQNYSNNLPNYTGLPVMFQQLANFPQNDQFLFLVQDESGLFSMYLLDNPNPLQFPSPAPYSTIISNYQFNTNLNDLDVNIMTDPTQQYFLESLIVVHLDQSQPTNNIDLFWPISQTVQTINFTQSTNGQLIYDVIVAGNNIFCITNQSTVSNITTNALYYIQITNYTNGAFSYNVMNFPGITGKYLYLGITQSSFDPDTYIILTQTRVLLVNLVLKKLYQAIPIQQEYSEVVQINDHLYLVASDKIVDMQIFLNKLDTPAIQTQTLNQFSQNYNFNTSQQFLAYTNTFFYVLDNNNQAINIYRGGANQFNTLYKSISLNMYNISVQNIISISALSQPQYADQLYVFVKNGNTFYNYFFNVFFEPTMAIGSVLAQNQMINTGNQIFLNLSVTSNALPGQAQNIFVNLTTYLQYNYSIPTFVKNSSNSSSVDLSNFFNSFLTINSNSPNQIFSFNPRTLPGLINYFNMYCSNEVECNQTNPQNNFIQFRNMLGFNRTLSKRPIFNSVAKSGMHTFAQARNQLIRLGFQNNTMLDLVQFPFSDPTWTCPVVQASSDDMYSFSACTNWIQWQIYGVSYVSSQPHVFGVWNINVQSVDRMYIDNDYIFILDSANYQFNQLHVFQLQVNLVDSTPSQSNISGVPVVNFTSVSTINFQGNSNIYNNGLNITDMDMNTMSTNSFLVFLAWQDGTVQFVNVALNGSLSYSNTLNMNTNLPFSNTTMNPTQVGVRVFQQVFNTTTNNYQYNMINVYQNADSFESIITVNSQLQIMFTNVVIRYQRPGFYEASNNIQVVTGADGFLVLPFVLPYSLQLINPIANPNATQQFYSQILVSYDRQLPNTTSNSESYVNGVYQNQIYGMYGINSTQTDFSFVAQEFSGMNQTSNYTILSMNPVTGTLDSLYLSRNVSFVFQNTSFTSNQITLQGSNLVNNQNYTFTIVNNLSSSSTSKLWIVFVVIGLVLVALIIIGAIKLYSNKKKKQAEQGDEQREQLITNKSE